MREQRLQELAELFSLRRRQLASEVGLTESQWRLFEEVAEEQRRMAETIADSTNVEELPW